MSFYIYENWQAGPHKAVLHLGSCGYCNEGRGRAGGYDPAHAKWHGPFDSLMQARKTQEQMNVTTRKVCRCVKEHRRS